MLHPLRRQQEHRQQPNLIKCDADANRLWTTGKPFGWLAETGNEVVIATASSQDA